MDELSRDFVAELQRWLDEIEQDNFRRYEYEIIKSVYDLYIDKIELYSEE